LQHQKKETIIDKINSDMKVYREVIIRGNEIYWIGSQMFSTKEGVLEALNQRAEKMIEYSNGKIEDFNRYPWQSYCIKEGGFSNYLTVECKKVVINGRNDSSIVGFVTYEVK
jgi:hypothetical protein